MWLIQVYRISFKNISDIGKMMTRGSSFKNISDIGKIMTRGSSFKNISQAK
jgi:hypothetical protein